MEPTLTQWYAISIAAFTLCLIIYRLKYLVSYLRIPITLSALRNGALRTLVYPLGPGASFFSWTRATRLHFSVVGIYYLVNGFCMGLGIHTTSDLMVRAGIMASINLIPLFLGGSTNILANYLGISIHTYYLAHHWIRRIVIIQSVLHCVLAIAIGTPWTFSSSQISGITSTSALALLLFCSFYFVRKWAYEFFVNLHLLLAFVVAVALLLHILLATPSRLPKPGPSLYVIIALSLWILNTAMKLSWMAYRNLGSRRQRTSAQGTVTEYLGGISGKTVRAMRLSVRLRKPIHVQVPGVYFYLSFSGMGARRQWQSHPYVVSWWDDSEEAMKLEFLIQPHSGISADLISRNSLHYVGLDGPYGKDLHLEKYETVILIANGIGIAGILPYLRHLTYRRISKDKDHEEYRRGLITRRIDVLWVLDQNEDERWISDCMLNLWKRDSDKLFLTMTCFYPDERQADSNPPVPADQHWRYIYNKKHHEIIKTLIVKQVERSPGTTKVVVCGDTVFSNDIRSKVIEIMDEHKNVEYAETEFQPQQVRKTYPGQHDVEGKLKNEIELDSFADKARDVRLRLSTQLKNTGKYKQRLEKQEDSQGLVSDGRLEGIEELDEQLERGSVFESKKITAREIV